MARWFYCLLLYVFSPLVLLRLWQRGRRAPAYRRRWRERFGWVTPVPEGVRFWVHSVSVGETIAAAPLVEALLARHPEERVLVTTMTPTGSDQVRKLFGDRVLHVYAPYDLPDAVARFLRRVRPAELIVMETELWPNLIHACSKRGIPVVLANARLSERSARGYGRVAWLSRPMLQSLDWIAAQADADAERFLALGAHPDHVSVCGSIKFDFSLSDNLREAARQLRSRLGDSRPVWIAASTHEGEDEILLDAHRRLLKGYPDAALILVPRHPERFNDVARLVELSGFTLSRRSQGAPAAGCQVLLGDTMGELRMMYGAADVAFVGGSLIESGGHNPLEPAAWGLPTLMGPHVFNFADICQRLVEVKGLCFAGSAEVLAQRLTNFFDDPEHRRAIGQQALDFVASNRGALQRLLEGVESRHSG